MPGSSAGPEDGDLRQVGSLLHGFDIPIVHGPFIDGGIGLSDYRVQKVKRVFLGSAFADSTYVAGTGLGFTLGAGWAVPRGEFRLGYGYGIVGALHMPDGAMVAKGWKQSLLWVQVEFRSGP